MGPLEEHGPLPTDWVDGIAQRDAEAMEFLSQFVRATCTPVFRRQGVADHELDEFVHQVFVSVCEFLQAGEAPPRNLRSFLEWRARGVFTRFLRERRRSTVDDEVVQGIAVSDGSALHSLTLAETRAALDECRRGLSAEDGRIWSLRYDHDWSVRRISAALGMPESTISVKLHRSRPIIEECLRRKGVLS